MTDKTTLSEEQRQALESMTGYDEPDLARLADQLLQSMEETN